MRSFDCGIKVVKCILEMDDSREGLPSKISLKYLAEKTECAPQLIGTAYGDYIKGNLEKQGILSKKYVKPKFLELWKK